MFNVDYVSDMCVSRALFLSVCVFMCFRAFMIFSVSASNETVFTFCNQFNIERDFPFINTHTHTQILIHINVFGSKIDTTEKWIKCVIKTETQIERKNWCLLKMVCVCVFFFTLCAQFNLNCTKCFPDYKNMLRAKAIIKIDKKKLIWISPMDAIYL